MKRNNIVVGHEHILGEDCICPGFIGSRFLQKLVNRHTLPFVLAMEWLIPWTKSDALSRYADFIRSENNSQTENFRELKSIYPRNSDFVILTVNMSGMGAGAPKKSMEKQLQEVISLKKSGENVKVFYHCDPTQNDCIELLHKYSRDIDGLKVYTLMGHYPTHPNLLKAYDWCGEHGKPVVFHTSPGSPVHFKGKRKELKKRLDHSRSYPLIKQRKRWPSKSDLCSNFTNPLYYEQVLKQYPGVNFDFAHLGGEKEILTHCWRRQVSMTTLLLNLIREYPNAYGDISYAFHDKRMQEHLKDMLLDPKLYKKLLYGTDFYMNKTVCTSQEAFYSDLKNVIGETNFYQIAVKNPIKFHYLNS